MVHSSLKFFFSLVTLVFRCHTTWHLKRLVSARLGQWRKEAAITEVLSVEVSEVTGDFLVCSSMAGGTSAATRLTELLGLVTHRFTVSRNHMMKHG